MGGTEVPTPRGAAWAAARSRVRSGAREATCAGATGASPPRLPCPTPVSAALPEPGQRRLGRRCRTRSPPPSKWRRLAPALPALAAAPAWPPAAPAWLPPAAPPSPPRLRQPPPSQPPPSASASRPPSSKPPLSAPPSPASPLPWRRWPRRAASKALPVAGRPASRSPAPLCVRASWPMKRLEAPPPERSPASLRRRR